MPLNDTSELEARFGIPGEVSFIAGPNGLALIEISNAQAMASIALQGAQILSWAPHTADSALWLAARSALVPGIPIRGGIPVCWPWFGPRAEPAGSPAHGFARTSVWEVTGSEALEDGRTRLVFRLIPGAAEAAVWPHRTPAELRCTVGTALEVELITRNEGAESVVLSEALHTYFHVSDVRGIAVHGLEDCEYLDKVDQGLRKRQQGPITFEGETDRVYVNTAAVCVIDDPVAARRIRIEKRGSASTVVWTPGAEKAAKMQGFSGEDHLRMVCVESGNAADNEIRLAPGEEHRLWVRYSIE